MVVLEYIHAFIELDVQVHVVFEEIVIVVVFGLRFVCFSHVESLEKCGCTDKNIGYWRVEVNSSICCECDNI